MVQITALSGETLAELDKDVYARMVEDSRSVKDLKQVLATETGFSRFRQRILVDGIGQLEDDMPLASMASMQLVILDFVADERSQKEFMRACKKNRVGKVEQLLQEPQDPNGSGDNIPIHAAAMGGHLQVLQLLLEARADTNAATVRGKTALECAMDCAVERGHFNFHVLKFLVESGAKANGYRLRMAAFCGSLEAVQLFLEAGADKNYAPENHITALHIAAKRGCLEMVRLLAEAGADIDAAHTDWVHMPPWVLMPTLMPAAPRRDVNAVKGLTALHSAVLSGHSEVVRFLLAAGADQNAVFDAKTLQGLTALHGAAWFGHVEVAQLLLQDGDKDVASSEGVRPLHLAAGAVRVEGPSFGRSVFSNKVVNVLLKARADVNAAARDGKTALHAAALPGNLKVVRLLLNAGADKDAAYYDSQREMFWRLASVDFTKKQLTWAEEVQRLAQMGDVADRTRRLRKATTASLREARLQRSYGYAKRRAQRLLLRVMERPRHHNKRKAVQGLEEALESVEILSAPAN
eukprot:s2143_g12.t1